MTLWLDPTIARRVLRFLAATQAIEIDRDDDRFLRRLVFLLVGVGLRRVGVGFRGTGYKFAPWVGRVLAQLAVTRGTNER